MAEEHFQRWQERAAGYGSDPHNDEDHDAKDARREGHEEVPEFTTPQGTQENGVDFQHEERDLDVRDLVHWFIGLAGTTLFLVLVLWGVFHLLTVREDRKDVVPSEMFTTREEPPLPRLLPNPVDARRQPRGPLQGPLEYGFEQREMENRKLEELGLRNRETGRAAIPEAALQGVLAAGPAANGPAEQSPLEVMPSDSSGGLSTEDRLR
jgi:hypothetical protein